MGREFVIRCSFEEQNEKYKNRPRRVSLFTIEQRLVYFFGPIVVSPMQVFFETGPFQFRKERSAGDFERDVITTVGINLSSGQRERDSKDNFVLFCERIP